MVLAFTIAWITSWVATPLVRRVAVAFNLVDLPGWRRMHAYPMPKAGGLGIYIAFWIALGVVAKGSSLWPLWLASTVVLGVGLVDDRHGLDWRVKLAGQFIGALIFVLWGGRIEFVTHPLTGVSVYVGLWGIPLTVGWLIALTNMVNLIDGLDGLAAGVCTIACIPLLLVSLALGRFDAAVLTAALAAATVGFLPHNFHPARIIMGDTGAMFLGFTLGAISVEGALKGPTALAFVVPVLVFGLPIFDTLFAVLRRLAARRPWYQADADHLHHRLLSLGFTHRAAVLTLYGISAVMATAALIAMGGSHLRSLGVLAIILAGATYFVARVGGLAGENARTSGTRRTL